MCGPHQFTAISAFLDLAQGDKARDAANCAQQLARNVWPQLAALVKVKLIRMSWPNAFEPALQDPSRCELCPLSRVKAGVAVRIRQLCASPEVQNRLRELGLCEDQIIRLVTSQTNFICQVCDARLAISEQLAQLILVEPLRSTVV